MKKRLNPGAIYSWAQAVEPRLLEGLWSLDKPRDLGEMALAVKEN